MNKEIPKNENLIENIFNSIKFIQNQIELISNSRDIFKNNKELIIFSYLLGYFSFKNKNIYQKEEIMNSILEFSCRDRDNNEDISNIVVNLSLILNNNFYKNDFFDYKNNIYFNNKDKDYKEKVKIKNDKNLKKFKEKEKIAEISDDDDDNDSIKEKEINNSYSSVSDSIIDNNNLINNNKGNININNNNININESENEKNKNINLDDNINLDSSAGIKNKLDKILNDDKKEEKFLGKKKLLPKKYKICDMCLEEFDENDSLNYELECGCIIHYECFDEHIKNAIKENNIPILCPYCKIEIHPNYIYDSLNINEHFDLIEKYEKYSMNNYIMNHKDNYSCCPTAGCEYMFFFEKGENRFLCPLCNKEYCLFCKEIWHKGMTCQEFQDTKDEKKLDEKFLNFAIGKNYKVCPNCNVWVEKTQGCNNMKCRCGHNFCYKCGKSISKHNYNCPCR